MGGLSIIQLSLIGSAVGGKAPIVPGQASQPPNIFLVVLDDVGWSDLSFRHKGAFPTPSLDALAAHEALVLDRFYVQPVCSP